MVVKRTFAGVSKSRRRQNGEEKAFKRLKTWEWLFGARRAGLSISQTADLLGFTHYKPSLVFTEEMGPKKRKIVVWMKKALIIYTQLHVLCKPTLVFRKSVTFERALKYKLIVVNRAKVKR